MHTVHQQSAIGGMVDLGLHTGRIQPELASFAHLRLHGELYHAVIQLVQGLRAQRARASWFYLSKSYMSQCFCLSPNVFFDRKICLVGRQSRSIVYRAEKGVLYDCSE